MVHADEVLVVRKSAILSVGLVSLSVAVIGLPPFGIPINDHFSSHHPIGHLCREGMPQPPVPSTLHVSTFADFHTPLSIYKSKAFCSLCPTLDNHPLINYVL